jgi:hypothetical protein
VAAAAAAEAAAARSNTAAARLALRQQKRWQQQQQQQQEKEDERPAAASQLAPAAAGAAVAAVAAAAAAAGPTAGAELQKQFGGLMLMPAATAVPEHSQRLPTLRPALQPRAQQLAATAAAAAAAGLRTVAVGPLLQAPACHVCLSLQHGGQGPAKRRCPLHSQLVAGGGPPAAGAGPAAGVDVGGPDVASLAGALRELADRALAPEVAALRSNALQLANYHSRREQRGAGAGADGGGDGGDDGAAAAAAAACTAAPAAAAGGSGGAGGGASGGRAGRWGRPAASRAQQQALAGLGLDPWSFVTAAVLLQEMAREAAGCVGGAGGPGVGGGGGA